MADQPLSRHCMPVLIPEYRREWIADEQPEHSCIQEAIWVDAAAMVRACGVCGEEIPHA